MDWINSVRMFVICPVFVGFFLKLLKGFWYSYTNKQINLLNAFIMPFWYIFLPLTKNKNNDLILSVAFVALVVLFKLKTSGAFT